MRRRRNRIPLNAEINVVSLIDVMMLLLVIFMITAPMMQAARWSFAAVTRRKRARSTRRAVSSCQSMGTTGSMSIEPR